MAKTIQVNPHRILWCSKEYQLPVEKIAELSHISIKTLQTAIDGHGELSIKQLQRLAGLFNRGILFFLIQQPVNEKAAFTPRFRTLESQKPGLSPKLKTLIQNAEKYREIYLYLLEETGQKAPKSWALPVRDPEKKPVAELASQARAWLSRGDQLDYKTLRTAVEDKGIFVITSNGHAGEWQIPKSENIRGFSLYFETCPVIVVRKEASEAAQCFTLAHELGHLLIHKQSAIDDYHDLESYKGKEKIANEFAGQLLAPDSFLQKIDFKEVKSIDDAGQYGNYLWPFAKEWGVSVEVILRRLLHRKVITSQQYNDYRQFQSEQKFKPRSGGKRYRYKEPLNIFGSKYVKLVFDSLHQDRITLSRASTLLDHLKIDYLKTLENHVRD